MLPYVNNENISNIYKILAPPYLKGNMLHNPNQVLKNRSNEKGIKNIEKYYEYNQNQNYKLKKSSNNNILDISLNYNSHNSPANMKIIPNRKLSPINNMKKMIKI
jgi:hypothetical protein